MSNRRRPKRQIPLDGPAPQAPALPLPLQRMEWTDEPAWTDYTRDVLVWIAGQANQAMRLNAWRCEVCDLPFIAYDRHPGTTPMTVAHVTLEPDTDCAGACVSVFYNREGIWRAAIDLGQGGQQIQPSHEWYRPSATELRGESAWTKSHVSQGGLLVRPVAA